MAATDRNKSGKPTDYVIHHSDAHGLPVLCGMPLERVGCISLGDVSAVTCLKCLKILQRTPSRRTVGQ